MTNNRRSSTTAPSVATSVLFFFEDETRLEIRIGGLLAAFRPQSGFSSRSKEMFGQHTCFLWPLQRPFAWPTFYFFLGPKTKRRESKKQTVQKTGLLLWPVGSPGMKCVKCGFSMPTGSKFCMECGTSVKLPKKETDRKGNQLIIGVESATSG